MQIFQSFITDSKLHKTVGDKTKGNANFDYIFQKFHSQALLEH